MVLLKNINFCRCLCAVFLWGRPPHQALAFHVGGHVRSNRMPLFSTLEPSDVLSSTSFLPAKEQQPLSSLSSPQNQTATAAMMDNDTSSSSLPLFHLALMGSAATFFADAVMHPLDSIKTVQQSHLGHEWNIPETFMYLWDHHGLYQGFWTYATADAIAGAGKFAVYETLCHASVPVPVAAALAFIVSSVPLVPGEFLKQQLQMGYSDGHLTTALADILQQHGGWTTLYTGYSAVLMRDIPYTILELGLYNITRRSLSPLVAAAVTGALTACVTTPLDTIKTQIMVGDLASWQDGMELLSSNDPVLWAGLSARVAWIVPFTMLYLPTFDGLKTWAQKRAADRDETTPAG